MEWMEVGVVARITAGFIAEQMEYLRSDREFYIEYDEFGGDESDLPELRRLLRRAAKAEGLRVHTRVYEDGAVWVYDPDWHPEPGDRQRLFLARLDTVIGESDRSQRRGVTRGHLRALN